jgi:hypothetical protein
VATGHGPKHHDAKSYPTSHSVLHRFRHLSFPFLPRRICRLSSERNPASWTGPGRKLRQTFSPIATNLVFEKTQEQKEPDNPRQKQETQVDFAATLVRTLHDGSARLSA